MRIGARECRLTEVQPTEASEFLSKYHIQGATGHFVKAFGLYYEGELISLATFGRHHRKSDLWVLSRFVTKNDWTVVGGLSRLSKAGFEAFGELISWADYRLSFGEGYIAAGWIQDEILGPDYFYTDMRRVFSKQSRKKDIVKTPDGMTEHEHAALDGLFKIFDCGKVRFLYKK